MASKRKQRKQVQRAIKKKQIKQKKLSIKQRQKKVTLKEAINFKPSRSNRTLATKVEQLLAEQLNKTVNLYKNSMGTVPKYLEKQMPLGRTDFGEIIDPRSGFGIEHNISSMQQLIEENDITTDEGREKFRTEFIDSFRGDVPKKNNNGMKYDYSNRYITNEVMQEIKDKLTVEDLLGVFEIIREAKEDLENFEEMYKRQDFDNMIMAATRGESPKGQSYLEYIRKARAYSEIIPKENVKRAHDAIESGKIRRTRFTDM